MSYYTVIIPEYGLPYIEQCDEYIKLDSPVIELGSGNYGVSARYTRAVAYCTFKEFESNIPHRVAFYDICDIERETFFGMNFKKAEYILKQLIEKQSSN